MGRFRRNKKGGSNNGKFGKRDNNHRGFHESWKDIEKENPRWESYYKELGLLSEEEFEVFKKSCQQTLPLTFRITGTRKHASEIRDIFEQKHLPNLTNLNIEGYEDYSPPKSLPWYPNHLGWQIDLPKGVIKKNPDYAKTQRFLVIETDVGNISRQEAVSMIPPLVLDVKPHHYVLDMCAAPGSKTSQLVEALHAEDKEPSGFVMANDSDYKRSHMLVHQVKRLNSANFIVVNHDAQMFPKMKLTPESQEYIKFDRVLCDVPCTGDATMRKNINVWTNWTPGNAIGLHPLQLNILNRGIQLLQRGGRLVYSTCSLNPIENEAVVAAALRQWGDQIRLVDCSDRLPGLKRVPGISNWKVFGKDMELREKGADDIHATVFPPTEEEAKNFNLDRCIRVYPHLQNTGGFFITVFEKIDKNSIGEKRKEQPDEEAEKKQKVDNNTSVNPVKKQRLPRDANEEPFNFLDPANEQLQKCWEFYGFDDKFDRTCTLVRNATGDPIRTIYYVAPVVKNVIQTNETRLKLVHSGVKLFVAQKSEHTCPWRLQNESLSIIKKHISKERVFECNLDVLLILLQEGFPNINGIKEKELDVEFIKQIENTDEGCCLINVVRKNPNEEALFLPLWKGKSNFNLMVSKQETFELLYRIYGIETEKQSQAKVVQEEPESQGKETPIQEAAETAAENPSEPIENAEPAEPKKSTEPVQSAE
ncbi:GQ67_04805T0 [Komagataella phaffii]|nr:GQ67_04805T0 [Komagataella phaffii]AOA70140.1 GQ68_04777T0 [Komagataella phaffii GS115]